MSITNNFPLGLGYLDGIQYYKVSPSIEQLLRKYANVGLDASKASGTAPLTGAQSPWVDLGKNQLGMEVYPIHVTAGTFDMEIRNATNVTWYFKDGSTSTVNRPTRTLAEAQTVYLVATFSDITQLRDNGTDARLIGNLNDIPLGLSYYADFYNCTNLTGNISVLSNLTYWANFYNCTSLTGDIGALSNLTYLGSFFNCTNLTGDISALSNLSYYANFFNCTNLTGILNPHPTLRYLYLDNTGLSINDVDQTVINLNNNTTATSERVLNISGLQRSSVSTAAINSLISKGWSVTDATVV